MRRYRLGKRARLCPPLHGSADGGHHRTGDGFMIGDACLELNANGTSPDDVFYLYSQSEECEGVSYENIVQQMIRGVTVKASNFGSHGNFGLFLAIKSVASVDESCRKNEQNRICRSIKFFYNFYSRHFSVGSFSTIASPSEIEVQS